MKLLKKHTAGMKQYKEFKKCIRDSQYIKEYVIMRITGQKGMAHGQKDAIKVYQ